MKIELALVSRMGKYLLVGAARQAQLTLTYTVELL